MSNLESIVPPLDLCEKIPAGEFEGSALVWVVKGNEEECAPRTMFNAIPNSWKVFPAPTLEEIITSLLTYGWLVKIDCRIQLDTLIEFYSKKQRQTEFGNTASETALRLWLKVKGVEVE